MSNVNKFLPKIGSLVVITNSELYYCKKDSIGIIFDTYKDGYEVKMVYGSWLECDDHKWFFYENDFVEFDYNQHEHLLNQGEFIYSNVEYLDKQRKYEKRVNNIRQKLSPERKLDLENTAQEVKQKYRKE